MICRKSTDLLFLKFLSIFTLVLYLFGKKIVNNSIVVLNTYMYTYILILINCKSVSFFVIFNKERSGIKEF